MDVLSAVSSVVAVVQIADRVISLCKTYITGVQDAPTDLRAILIEVGSVKCVLETLELLTSSKNEDNSLAILRKLEGHDGPLEGCREALKGLEALFPPQSQSPVQGKRQRVALSLASLAWPFKRDRGFKLLGEIGRHKATISLGLTTEAAQDLKHIRSHVEQISKATDHGEFDRILKWLVTTDPSSNHNNACELHEPHTGKWLTNSPEYESWKNCSTRFLWLHGIPGAGKTVLLSYIAEDVKKFCKTGALEGAGFAYYYCYFARSQDETPHLLRWVISQLCRQIDGIPPEVRQLFRQGGQPSTSELVNLLAGVIQNFTQVYLVIDALDESSKREKMLRFLRNVVEDNKLQRIQLLAMSREETDIERALLSLGTDISLSNSYVDEGIRTYIQRFLRTDQKFSRWFNEHPDLEFEIEIALVNGAKGMFRWVVCQLDILKRLDFIADIREALSELPETLDETYERILCNIPPESQVLASKTLNLLSSGLLDDLGELLDALAVDLDRLSYSRDNRPLDQYAPIAVCTCLVTYNGGDGELEEGSVRFAHYTVKEYIMSPRVATGCASLFHVTDETVDFLVARCLIIYLLDANYDSYGSLMLKAITKWQEPAGLVKSEPSKRLIHTLILRLLNPTRSHFEKFIIELESYSDDFNLERPIAWRAEQGAEICTTLAYLCWYGFIEAAQTLLEQQTERIPFESPLTRLYCLFEWFPIDKDNPLINNVKFMSWVGGDKFDTQPAGQQTITIIHIAAMLRQTTFLELFISKGADLTVKSITGLGVLASALGPGLQDGHHYDVDYWREAEERQKFLSLLVPNDASPGLGAVSVTPLQVAIRQYFNSSACRAIIAKLLASGEDVNGVADDGANVTRIRHVCDWYFTEIAQPKLRSQRKSCIEAALHRRGQSGLYDTPLRILKTRIAGYRDMIGCDIDDPKYRALLDTCFLLESNGARSLHLFPVKELPGYCGEDMEEWHGSGMNETSSQPGSPNFPQPSSLGRDRFIPGRVEELVDSTPEEFNSIRLPVVESNNTNSDPVSLPSIHSFWNVVNN